jgi:hypothetical protein
MIHGTFLRITGSSLRKQTAFFAHPFAEHKYALGNAQSKDPEGGQKK